MVSAVYFQKFSDKTKKLYNSAIFLYFFLILTLFLRIFYNKGKTFSKENLPLPSLNLAIAPRSASSAFA